MMADEDETDTGNALASDGSFDNSDGNGGKNKLPLIAGVLALLVIGGGAAAFFTGALDGLLGESSECVEEVDEDGNVIKECPKEKEMAKPDKAAKSGKGGKDGDKVSKFTGASFLEIPTMIVNLNTDSGTPRYLRLSVQLELNSAEDVLAVEAVIPRVVDQFQTYLRELRVRDLRGSAGIYRLQMELLWRVNQAAAPVEVKDVLFQEILIQ